MLYIETDGATWTSLNPSGATIVDGGFKIRALSAAWNCKIYWYACD